MAKIAKNFIDIEIPDPRKKGQVSLRESSWERLEQYRRYLSLQIQRDVETDAVIEGLVKKLENDRAFMKWAGTSDAARMNDKETDSTRSVEMTQTADA